MRIEIDKFNSEIFQNKIGNILDIRDDTNYHEIEKIIKLSMDEQYNFLFTKINTNFQNVVNRFINKKFNLIDTQVTYCLKCKDNIVQRKVVDGISFRKFKKSDISDIAAIASMSFFLDQFHLDKDLDSQMCNRYYEQWAINSCNGFADDVFVLDNGKLIGFITVNYCVDNATVGLAAISPFFQGKGFFNLLISETICELRNNGINMLYYGTQLCNAPVHKTMGKFQGALISSAYVLHKKLCKV